MLALSVFGNQLHAQLNIEISGAGSNLLPLVVGSFVNEASVGDITSIVREDLSRSGRFRLIDQGWQPLAEEPAPSLVPWQSKGAVALVAGSVSQRTQDQFEVRFRVFDVNRQNSIGGLAFAFTRAQTRLIAHKIADAIYEMLLHEPGVFATRLSYVSRVGNQYQLLISDADGANPQTALSSSEPIISPAWSPDGRKVAYVSFEQRKPIVYVHDLPTGQRTIGSNVKGNNSAPNWSADGKFLAVALSRDGNTQIYKMVLNGRNEGGNPQRMTKGSSIDTEPQFSADGKWIYFTSDRGGAPQIYRMSAATGERESAAVRVTFQGKYNTSPRISPDGKLLAFISRQPGGALRLMVQDLDSGTVNSISDTDSDESPSFAANGKYLLYSTRIKGKQVLVACSVDGKTRNILSMPSGSVREPAWGPFAK